MRKKVTKSIDEKVENTCFTRGIKLRLYPNNAQRALINKSLGCDRFIYNWALALKKRRYDEFKENIGWLELNHMITNIVKQSDEFSWLKEPSASVLTQSLMKLDSAYSKFFKGAGFPKFKKRREFNSFVLSDTTTVISDSQLKLPKLGIIKVAGFRKFEGRIKNVTVSKDASGNFYATFVMQDVEKKIKDKSLPKKSIGIDVNIENFLTDSNGVRIENPRIKQKFSKKLKYLDRKMAKCKKVTNPKTGKKEFSKNYEKLRVKRARIFNKINNIKSDFLHKLSTNIVKNHDEVVIEKLQIRNMLKNHNLAEAISNVSWGKFFEMLRYKGQWYDCDIIEVSPHNTSQICSVCGEKSVDKLGLNVREWDCRFCGAHHVRDFNSAKNVQIRGTKKIKNKKERFIVPKNGIAVRRGTEDVLKARGDMAVTPVNEPGIMNGGFCV
jgi:putative transposase